MYNELEKCSFSAFFSHFFTLTNSFFAPIIAFESENILGKLRIFSGCKTGIFEFLMEGSINNEYKNVGN